jgi:superfamily II DNA helicase RecQ
MRSIDALAALYAMYGPEARFRSVQQPALDAIINGCPRVIVVIRTGGGKSLLFILPVWAAPSGVTIVVIPKVMLQEDIADRYR